jgi:hypothetical protein
MSWLLTHTESAPPRPHWLAGKAPSERTAFQPYWGKLAGRCTAACRARRGQDHDRKARRPRMQCRPLRRGHERLSRGSVTPEAYDSGSVIVLTASRTIARNDTFGSRNGTTPGVPWRTTSRNSSDKRSRALTRMTKSHNCRPLVGGPPGEAAPPHTTWTPATSESSFPVYHVYSLTLLNAA